MRYGGWALAVCVGCGLEGAVDGTVEAEVAEFDAKWHVSPNECRSGEPGGFLGVDLVRDGDEETLVRVVADPVDGYQVGTNIPGTDRAVFVSAADMCEVFDVDVVRTSTRINNIWNVEGHAIVDCVLPGLTLRVDINFSGCH